MFVTEQIPKCVCFLCVKAQGEHGEYDHFIGTAFFIGLSFQSSHYQYLATARHTIREAKTQGYSQFFVRLNTKEGGSQVIPIADEWVYPENEAIDVAVLPFNSSFDGSKDEEFDHAALATSVFTTDEVIKEIGVGLGDELLVIGLFKHRWGLQRNIPIARTGNIAAMPDEPFIEDSGEAYNAYLTEMRSIGGLSGSPVFVFKLVPPGESEIRERQARGLKFPPLPVEKMYILGLVRSHWDLERQNAAEDIGVIDEDGEIDYLNTGIAQVTPIQEVLALLNGEKLMKQREEEERNETRKHDPTFDSNQLPLKT